MDGLNDIANSFNTYEDIYDQIMVGDYTNISRACGTNEYPIIGWMLEYFVEKEDYNRCHTLQQTVLPKPTLDRLNYELEWLAKNNK